MLKCKIERRKSGVCGAGMTIVSIGRYFAWRLLLMTSLDGKKQGSDRQLAAAVPKER